MPASDLEPLRPQLLAADPELVDLSYGPEAYDAAILIALAAVAAKTYDPGAIRNHLIAVSRDGIECSGFAERRDLLVTGEAIDYSAHDLIIPATALATSRSVLASERSWKDCCASAAARSVSPG